MSENKKSNITLNNTLGGVGGGGNSNSTTERGKSNSKVTAVLGMDIVAKLQPFGYVEDGETLVDYDVLLTNNSYIGRYKLGRYDAKYSWIIRRGVGGPIVNGKKKKRDKCKCTHTTSMPDGSVVDYKGCCESGAPCTSNSDCSSRRDMVVEPITPCARMDVSEIKKRVIPGVEEDFVYLNAVRDKEDGYYWVSGHDEYCVTLVVEMNGEVVTRTERIRITGNEYNGWILTTLNI